MLHIGESAAVSCMTAIHGRLWCGLGCNAVIVNTTTLVVEVRLSFLSFLGSVKKAMVNSEGKVKLSL